MRPTTPPRPVARPARGPWSFGPLWGTFCALAAIVVTSQVGRVFDLLWWVPLGVTGAALALVTAVWLYRQAEHRSRPPYADEEVTPGRALPYRLGCVAAGGMWSTWVAVLGYSPGAWIALVLGGLTLAAVSPLFAPRTPPRVDPAQLAALLPPSGAAQVVDPLMAKWRQLLDLVLLVRDGKPGTTVSKIEHWDRKTGYSVHGLLPAGSRHTYRSIAEETAGLASSLRLPKGCPIKVDEGPHQGAFVIKVSTVNDLDTMIAFPLDLRRRSATEDFAIGIHRDGSLAMIDFYQSSAVVVGMRGSGKTGVMQSMTATAVQCVDGLVWHVDLNGGSISAPWVSAWANGQADRPAVDWAATTAGEAIRMATVGLAIAKDRKSRFQHLLLNEDTDVLPLSPEVPAILIIVDEGAEMFGEDATPEAVQAATMLRELQRIGRAMCVNVIFSVMRGTRDCVPAGMKKLTAVKVVMAVDDDGEIAYVLDWTKGLRADDLTAKGSGFLRRDKAPPEMFKGYWLSPANRRRISIETAPWRPQLDRAGQGVGGRIYAERWQREETVAWLDRLAGRVHATGELAQVLAVDADEVEARVTGTVSPAAMAAAMANFADGFKAKLATEAQAPAGPVDHHEPGQVATVVAMTDEQHDDPGAQTAEEAAADQSGYDLVCQWVREAGPDGIKREQLVALATEAGVTRRQSTVSNWLSKAADAGLVESKPDDWAKWIWVVDQEQGSQAA